MVLPANSSFATDSYINVDLSPYFNSDAYTPGQNYVDYETGDGHGYYHIYPGTSFLDNKYGIVPLLMKPYGEKNVWLSAGLMRTSDFDTQLTVPVNIPDSKNIWVAGLNHGWGDNEGTPVTISYILDGRKYSQTYKPKDWCLDSTDPLLSLWASPPPICGSIAVARLDLPHAGNLTEIRVSDENGLGESSIPVFAITVKAADRLASVTVNQPFLEVKANSSKNITVIANYLNGSSKDISHLVTYRSSNNLIATVNSSGAVKGKRSGTADIYITYKEKENIQKPKEYSSTVKVIVAK